MSTFDDGNYRWRETYFVFFSSSARPSMARFQQAFSRMKKQFELSGLRGDDEGLLESVTVVAADAHAAIDISYIAGEEVAEQLKTLGRELQAVAETADERAKVEKLSDCDARFDVLHFERVGDVVVRGDLVDRGDDDDCDEVLDPGALLLVLERLVKLCGGVGVDPAASAVM